MKTPLKKPAYKQEAYTFMVAVSPEDIRNGKVNNSYTPSSIARIWDEAEEDEFQIRYGKGIRSIFVEDQPEDFDTRKGLIKINFFNGTCVVNAREKYKLEFLMNHPCREGNEDLRVSKAIKTRFKLYEPQAEAKRTLQSQANMVEAMQLIFTGDFEKSLKPVARYVGINMNNSVDEIKHDLIRHAQSDPEYVKELFSSTEVDRYSEVCDAFDKRIIVLEGSAIKFAGSRTTICQLPAGMDKEQYFTEASFADENVKNSWSEVSRRLRGEDKKESDVLSPDRALKQLMESDKEQVARMALNIGLISKPSKQGSIYLLTNAQGEEVKKRGYAEIVTYYEDNPEEFKLLCTALSGIPREE